MKTKAKLLVLLLLIVMVFCTACGPTGDPEPTSYTVTFTSEGDITIPSQTIEEGQTATRPEAPTRDGYQFLGWYLDAEGEHMCYTDPSEIKRELCAERVSFAKEQGRDKSARIIIG